MRSAGTRRDQAVEVAGARWAASAIVPSVGISDGIAVSPVALPLLVSLLGPRVLVVGRLGLLVLLRCGSPCVCSRIVYE